MREHHSALAEQMCALADTGHPRAEDLRERAAAVDRVAKGYYASPQTVPFEKFDPVFSRAARFWRMCAGRDVV